MLVYVVVGAADTVVVVAHTAVAVGGLQPQSLEVSEVEVEAEAQAVVDTMVAAPKLLVQRRHMCPYYIPQLHVAAAAAAVAAGPTSSRPGVGVVPMNHSERGEWGIGMLARLHMFAGVVEERPMPAL